MNKFIGIGYIGKKGIDLQFTTGAGKAIAKYTLSIPRAYQQGDKKEYDYLPCITWGKPAEFLANNGDKIKKLCVEGRVQTRTWEKDGKKNYVTEIVTDSVEVVEWNGEGQAPRQEQQGQEQSGFTPVEDDDIPF